MNEGRDVWAGGNLSEKNAAMKKTMNRGLLLHKGGELFHKKTPLTENEILEKELAGVQEYVTKERERRKAGLPFGHSPLVEKEGTSEGAKRGWETRREGGAGTEEEKPKAPSKAERMGIQNPDSSGMGSHPDHDKHPLHETLANAGLEYSHSVVVTHGPGDDRVHHSYKIPGTKHFVGVHPTAKGGWMWESGKAGSGHMTTGGDAAALASHLKRADKGLDGDESVRISKDEIEKIMKDGGWDKLPLTDRAREIVEDAISRGAKPATEYTGKLLVEHAIPEEPPAFTRPKNLKVGDTVIPLNWVGVCTQGAKFDLPSVPEAFKVKKMYTGPAKVTKNSYPYGRYPSDISKVETVTEDRLWGLELDDRLGKEDDGTSSMSISTRDTTLVLRLDPQATPSGEVNPGVSQRD